MGYSLIIKLYADGVQMAEGNNVRDLNIRNNNPGNIREWPSYPQGEGGFVKTPSFTEGVQMLWENLYNHFTRNQEQTIMEYINSYAPPSDGNLDNSTYCATVLRAIQVYYPHINSSTLLGALINL